MEMRLQNTCRQLYWTTNLPHVQPKEEQKAEEGEQVGNGEDGAFGLWRGLFMLHDDRSCGMD